MALEALTSNEFINFIIYDTISATPESSSFLVDSTTCTTSFIPHSNVEMSNNQQQGGYGCLNGAEVGGPGRRREGLGVQGVARKRRRRKPRVCKNKEEAETQRMTHIAVERNRRKQMNEHLAVLRSLMPEFCVQKGDQASIVGGAIEFVKELEHRLQSLEAQKFQLLRGLGGPNCKDKNSTSTIISANSKLLLPPFSQFFVYPQYTWSQMPNKKFTSKTKASIADIEVTLIETHANMRIFSRRSPRQLPKLVAGFHTLELSILHINVTTMHTMVLYSISAKLGEGCLLNTVDDIAGAVHHMLRVIEEEAALC